jgi:hypothetical protein
VTVLRRLQELHLLRDHRDGIRLLGHLLQDVGTLHLRDDLDRHLGDLVPQLSRDEALRLGVVPWGEEYFRGSEQPDVCPYPVLKQRGCFRGAEHLLGAFPYLEQWKTDCFRDVTRQLQALRPLEPKVQLGLLALEQVQVLGCHRQVPEALVQPWLVLSQRVLQQEPVSFLQLQALYAASVRLGVRWWRKVL